MPRAVCSFVPWLSAPTSLGTITRALKLRPPPRQRFAWSKHLVFGAAHEYHGNKARAAVKGDDLHNEDAVAAAAAEEFLLQLDAGLEYNALLICDDSPDSASEIGTGASTAAVANHGRNGGQAVGVHRSEKHAVGVKRNYPSVAASRRDDGVAGKRPRAGTGTGTGFHRDKKGNDLRRRRQNLLQEVKEASSKGSWQEVLAAKGEARSRGLRLDGRTHTAFVHAALDLGGPAAALEAIKGMRLDGFVPNLALYNKAISLCGRHGLWEEAIILLRETQAAGGGEGNVSSPGEGKAGGKGPGETPGRGGEGSTVSPGRIGVNVVTYSAAITACRNGGKWEEALSLMEEMQTAGIKPDQIAFGTAVSACAMGRQWERALTLLKEMRRASLRPDVIAYSSAIKACGRGGRWEEALDLLKVMEEEDGVTPNILTYTAAVKACGRAGQWKKALWLLSQVRDRQLRPDAVTLNAVMDALGRAGETEKALALLETMRPGSPPVSAASWTSPTSSSAAETTRRGGHPRADVFTWSAAMTACIEGGEWERVEGMLDEMRAEGVSPNVINYNLAIKALAKGGQWRRAMELLESMEASGVSPDERTYSAAIEACGRGGSWERAVSLVDDMRQAGLTPDELIYSTVIAACDRGGAWDVALMVLDEAREGQGTANVFAYTAAISACGKVGHWEKAVSLLDVMKKEGVAPNAVTLRSVLLALEHAPPPELETRGQLSSVPDDAAFGDEGEEETTRDFYWADPTPSIKPIGIEGEVGTGGIGDGYSPVPALPWEIAISLLGKSAGIDGDNGDDVEEGEFPSPRDFASALTAAFFGGAEWPSIVKVLDMMHARLAGDDLAVGSDKRVQQEEHTSSKERGEGRGVERDPPKGCGGSSGLVQAYNQVIRTCGSAGGADVALALIEEMHRRGVRPDAMSYSSAIVACDLAGMWSEAVHLLDDMRNNAEQEPDLVCYNCVIKACGSGGEWEAALSVLQTMREEGIAPDEITYSSAIAACGNAGEARAALDLLKEMKTEGVPVGLITYNAALSACDKGGGEWEATTSVLEGMRAAGVRPDAISYSAAMSSSEKAGEWRATLELYDQLRADIVAVDYPPEDVVGFGVGGAGEGGVSREGTELPPPRLTLAALTACARGGQWKKAMDILREAKAKGVGSGDGIRSYLGQASSLAFNAALVACAKGAEFEASEGREGGCREAIEILDMMGRSPDPTSYGCAITACGFGGKVEACVDLLGEMLRANQTPTLADYLASLRACAARGRADAAQEIMDSMASEFVEPDARCYRLAAEAFRKGGAEGHDAKSCPESDRLLRRAEDMEASAAARRVEGSGTAGVDLRALDLTNTLDLEALLETSGGDLDIVEPEEGL